MKQEEADRIIARQDSATLERMLEDEETEGQQDTIAALTSQRDALLKALERLLAVAPKPRRLSSMAYQEAHFDAHAAITGVKD